MKALGVCHVLEERMMEFKNSIPLFADLKNDALRERYVSTQLSNMFCSVILFLFWFRVLEERMMEFFLRHKCFSSRFFFFILRYKF